MLLAGCQFKFDGLQRKWISHIFREGNFAADIMDNTARESEEGHLRFNDYSQKLKKIVLLMHLPIHMIHLDE